MAKSKLIEKDDVVLSEEVLAQVELAKAPNDVYSIPQPKDKDVVTSPGHTRRDFRN